VAAFLAHLEEERGNTVRTRNARLAAIHSFFRYAATREPAAADHIQRVLAIPHKRHGRGSIAFLTPEETDVLLAAPDRGSWLPRPGPPPPPPPPHPRPPPLRPLPPPAG